MWSNASYLVVPAMVNFALFLYSVFLPANRVNRLFSLFIFLLGIAQLCDAMMHSSTNMESAAMWQHIALSPWTLIAPIGVLFCVEMTNENRLNKSWFFSLTLMPALVLQFMIAAHLDNAIMFDDPFWGWIGNPVSDAPTIAIYLYVTCLSLLMPVLLWNAYYRHRKNSRVRTQFLLLAIGVTVPYLGGVICEVILPLSFGVNDIPVAGPLMTTFTVCSFIAIRKHRLLDYSPRHQFNRILETMTDGVMITDNSGRIMYANPALAKMVECTSEELVGHTTDFFLQDKQQRVFIPEGTQELQLRCRNGQKIWVVASASPCVDSKGKEIGITCVVTDVDEQKRAHEKISRNEERLKRAQAMSHVGSWELDFATGKTRWSAEACRIFGYPETQNLQPFDNWIQLIHPADMTAVMLAIKNTQSTGTDSDFEHRIVLKNGTVKHIHSIIQFEYDEQNVPVGLFAICQDVTEIRTANQKLQLTTEELETYIYKSSHDMHAPLASILGLINVSRMEVHDPSAMKYLQMIEGQAKKLDSVRVEFIKAMHIKDTNYLDEEVHVNTMIGDILRELRMSEGFSRMNFNINVAPGQKVIANEFLMKTILQNLIENSIKYQDYTRDQPELLIDLEQRGATTSITIEDNGVGIDPSLHDKIFDMYFKTEDNRDGSGLGLYLVKKAVEKLDGKMSLRSSPGQGTRFTLQFAQAN
jgi:PAS domain S-box-containing protein